MVNFPLKDIGLIIINTSKKLLLSKYKNYTITSQERRIKNA